MSMTEAIGRRRSVPRHSGSNALARIETHEEVCAQRWAQILARMDRMERVLIWAAGSLIVGMATVIATVAMKGHLL